MHHPQLAQSNIPAITLGLANRPEPRYAEAMPGPFHPSVNSWKDLVVFPGWGKQDADDRSMTFAATIDIGGVTIPNLWFRGRCIEDQPDREVIFQLEVGKDGARTRVPLMRVDWRPLSGGHANVKGPPDLINTYIEGSHFHSFIVNWLEEEQRMRTTNLPVAVKISEPLQSFSELLDFVKIQFRINGIERVTEPEWVQELF